LNNDVNITTDFEKFFDALAQNWKTIEDEIKPAWNKKEWSFYNSGITQSDRVIFLAITSYLERNIYSSKSFKEWMRVVWNIIENTDIADVRSMIGAMRLIQELAIEERSSDIYSLLGDESFTIESSSSKIAISEERKKASFIISDINWEKSFIKAESHPFFKGAVSFLITDNMSIQEFNHRYVSASKVFTNNGINNEFRGEGHIFLRALISRFDNKSIIGNNFTDLDEGEHYLKKLLASNATVQTATREWFCLPFEELMSKLKQETEKESQIPGWSENNEWEKIRIKRAHEALYKYPELQNWMQANSAIRFSWASGHLYISRPRSWYDWIQVESIRNEVIHQLINQGFKTDAENIRSTSFYKGGNNIELYGEINATDFKISFDYLTTVKIAKRVSEKEWLNIAEYNYVQEDENLLDLMTIENLEELLK
jgi:ribosomal protein L31